MFQSSLQKKTKRKKKQKRKAKTENEVVTGGEKAALGMCGRDRLGTRDLHWPGAFSSPEWCGLGAGGSLPHKTYLCYLSVEMQTWEQLCRVTSLFFSFSYFSLELLEILFAFNKSTFWKAGLSPLITDAYIAIKRFIRMPCPQYWRKSLWLFLGSIENKTGADV